MDKIFGYRYYDSTTYLESGDYVRLDSIVIDNVPYIAYKGFGTVATRVWKIVQPGELESVFVTAVKQVGARWIADSGTMYTYEGSRLYTHDLLTTSGSAISYTSIGSMGTDLLPVYLGGHISSSGEEIVDVVGGTGSPDYTLWWCRWTDGVQGTPVELSRTPIGTAQYVYSDIISQDDKVIFYLYDSEFSPTTIRIYKCEIDVGTTDQTYTYKRLLNSGAYTLYVSPDARYYKKEEPPVLGWDVVGIEPTRYAMYDFTSEKTWDFSSYPYAFDRDDAILWLPNKDFIVMSSTTSVSNVIFYCQYETGDVIEVKDQFQNGFMNDPNRHLYIWPYRGPSTRGSGLFQSPDFRFTLLGTREADPGVTEDWKTYQMWRDKGKIDA